MPTSKDIYYIYYWNIILLMTNENSFDNNPGFSTLLRNIQRQLRMMPTCKDIYMERDYLRRWLMQCCFLFQPHNEKAMLHSGFIFLWLQVLLLGTIDHSDLLLAPLCSSNISQLLSCLPVRSLLSIMSDTEYPNRKRRNDVAAFTGASPNTKSPSKKKPNRSGSKSRQLQENLQVGYAAITDFILFHLMLCLW